MAGNERFEDRIGSWLEGTAPASLPRRVLESTFEQTRRTRQDIAWREVLGRLREPLFVRGLGGAAAIVVATAVLAVSVGLIGRTSEPTPAPSATTIPSAGPISPPGFLWPQTTLDEVRRAQELVDAGDPRHRWQTFVEGGQVGQHHPCGGAGSGCLNRAKAVGGNGEIFVRFLEEVLGWEEYFWSEEWSHIDGLKPGDLVFVRCAAGSAPVYPADPQRPICAPSIGNLQYERVKVNVTQLGTSIWVVTGWEIIEPIESVVPPSDAQARAFLEAFAQARIDGEGAELFADFPPVGYLEEDLVRLEIPLLYATSTGAPYEQSSFEVVAGPMWPEGWSRILLRMFADGGQVTVEQRFLLAWDESHRLRLKYEFSESLEEGAGTIENGNAVPLEYAFLGGEVTYRAAYPLGPSQEEERKSDRLAVVEGPNLSEPTRRILFFMADPRTLSQGCEASAPTDAQTLARTLRSVPNSTATAPVAVTFGELSGLQMDGVIAHATTPCVLLEPTGGPRSRLYLLDLPGGSAGVLGIAVAGDEDSFDTVLSWAIPVINSLEFHAP